MNITTILLMILVFFPCIIEAKQARICENIAFSIAHFKEPYENDVDSLPTKQIFIEESSPNNHFVNSQASLIADYITEFGLEKYIAASLQGEFELVMEMPFLGSISILDIAILNGADAKTLEKIEHLGFTISDFTFKTLYSASQDRVSLLKKYKQIIDLNSMSFQVKNRNLNITNFTLFNSDFYTLYYLLLDPDGPNLNNVYNGDLIDLSFLELENYAQLNQLFDVGAYKKQFESQIKFHLEMQDYAISLSNQYNYFQLIETCTNSWKSINAKEVLFAVSSDHVDKVYQQLDVSDIKNFAQIDKKTKNPIYSEVFSRIKQRNYLNKYDIVNVETIGDIDESDSIINTIGPYELLIDEYNLIYHFDNTLDYNKKNIRVDKVAQYITSNAEKILNKEKNITKQLKGILKKLNNKRRFGKNLSYYVFLYTNNEYLLERLYDGMGEPKSEFGLNIVEHLAIVSIYDENSFKKITFLLNRGYPLNINSHIEEKLLLNTNFYQFYKNRARSTKGIHTQ